MGFFCVIRFIRFHSAECIYCRVDVVWKVQLTAWYSLITVELCVTASQRLYGTTTNKWQHTMLKQRQKSGTDRRHRRRRVCLRVYQNGLIHLIVKGIYTHWNGHSSRSGIQHSAFVEIVFGRVQCARALFASVVSINLEKYIQTCIQYMHMHMQCIHTYMENVL